VPGVAWLLLPWLDESPWLDEFCASTGAAKTNADTSAAAIAVLVMSILLWLLIENHWMTSGVKRLALRASAEPT
jgi:hypothetical protein